MMQEMEGVLLGLGKGLDEVIAWVAASQPSMPAIGL